jgi:hypothetical protein
VARIILRITLRIILLPTATPLLLLLLTNTVIRTVRRRSREEGEEVLRILLHPRTKEAGLRRERRLRITRASTILILILIGRLRLHITEILQHHLRNTTAILLRLLTRSTIHITKRSRIHLLHLRHRLKSKTKISL